MGSHARGELALVLSGGGARAAFQVGVLRHVARRWPDARFAIVTGTSAGSINAVHLAAHPGPFAAAVESLTRLWLDLTTEHVFRADAGYLAGNVLRWGARLVAGGSALAPATRGLVDTSPLRRYLLDALGTADGHLPAIAARLREGVLRAVGITTTNYATGQSITWCQGTAFEAWTRPHRKGVEAALTVEHVLASAALPLIFPAIRLGDQWHGDGDVRLTAPLAPALHLGATRILAVSTRYRRTTGEADEPQVIGYPPPIQILGVLLNAIFLDNLDFDALQMERINVLLDRIPDGEHAGLRKVGLTVLRPGRDLGRLAAAFEPTLPGPLRFMTRGLGTRETRSQDLLSLLMFERPYIERLIALGEADGAAREEELVPLLGPPLEPAPAPAPR